MEEGTFRLTREDIERELSDVLGDAAIVIRYTDGSQERTVVGVPYEILNDKIVIGAYFKDLAKSPPQDYEERKKHISIGDIKRFGRTNEGWTVSNKDFEFFIMRDRAKEYIRKNQKTLRAKYGDEYLFFADGEVVDHDKERRALFRRTYHLINEPSIWGAKNMYYCGTIDDVINPKMGEI